LGLEKEKGVDSDIGELRELQKESAPFVGSFVSADAPTCSGEERTSGTRCKRRGRSSLDRRLFCG